LNRTNAATTTLLGATAIHFVVWLLVVSPATAQFRVVDANEAPRKETIALPFAFYTSDIEVAGGAAWGLMGAPQEQMSLFLAGYGSTNASWGVPFVAQDVQLPFGDRLFLDATGFIGHYDESRAYWDGHLDFPLEQAGSNESNEDNYLEGRMHQYFVYPTFKYVLPIGTAQEDAIHTYFVQQGMLVENPMGAGSWNPFDSGRTYLELTPFYRSESVRTDAGREFRRTNGVEFSVIYDNRNFHANPSRGSRQSLSVLRDWNLWDSSNAWTSLEADYSKFISLPAPSGIRQHVLALNLWTAYAPTWEQIGTDGNGQPLYRRPPEFMGPRLGGFWRMRAFVSNRFSDKAAIYYSAEFRLMPEWNPLGSISWFDRLDVKWIQGVIFAEAGRVAPSWRIDELHQDMQWDVGVGLRIWGKGVVGRADIAFAEESTALRLMIGQTF
jgi:hypothetical protein